MKTRISAAELKVLLDADPTPFLVDVRTPLEFAEVHVPQARNIPLDELNPTALLAERPSLAREPVYLLCRTGSRAARAAEILAKSGLKQPVVVEGGTLAWIESGLPVHRSSIKVVSLERQVRIVAGSIVLSGVLLGYFVHPAFFGLSGFVGAGLVFAGITDFCGMALLLAKLPYNKRARSSH